MIRVFTLSQIYANGLAYDFFRILLAPLIGFEAICRASGLPVELYSEGPEDNVCQLLTHWYHANLQQGGERDPVQDDLIAEALTEDASGQPYSYPPGRA